MSEQSRGQVLFEPSRLFGSAAAYDVVARIPLVALFGFISFVYASQLIAEVRSVQDLNNLAVLQLLARVAGLSFVLLVTVAVLFRLPAIARRAGLLSRLVALGGAFSLMALPLFPKADMSLEMAATSFALIILGHAFSCYALSHLGRALSLMAEARTLVTTGPYAFVRHPLYAAEALGSLGILLQYLSPVAVLVWLVHISLQVGRMRYEEQVLRQAFPDYAAYESRTARILPGVF